MTTPYQEGYSAASSGLKLSANPYTPGIKEYDSWEDGWCAYWNETVQL